MKSTNLNKKLKWNKAMPVIANIISALLFFTAYYFQPTVWFLVAAFVNIAVAVLIVIMFNKFEKKYSGLINKSENNT